MSVEEHRHHAPRALRVALITVSDTRTPDTDDSGKLLRKLVEERGHRADAFLVKDDPDAIRGALEQALAHADAVVLNGGTGVSPRDVTIETLQPLFRKELPGFGELFRELSFRDIGSAAMLSRATAGLVGTTPVFALPGSPDAVALAMERLVLPELPHVVGEARKGTGKPGDPLTRRDAPRA